MKNICLAVFFILTLFFSACVKQTVVDPSPNGDIPTKSENALDQAAAETQFAAAEEACAWFSGYAQPKCNGEPATLFGQTYEQVADERFADLAELKSYLSSLFCADFTQELLATEARPGAPVFVEDEGKLYMCGGYTAQLPYDIGERQFSFVSAESAGDYARLTLTYTARLYDLGPFSLSMDYNLAADANGNWRFDYFVLPLQLLENRAEFSCRVGDGYLMLGMQQGEFPWGYDLTELGRTEWQMDGFHSGLINCEQLLSLSVFFGDGSMMLSGVLIAGSEHPTRRNAAVGMSEEQLLECYPSDLYAMETSHPTKVVSFHPPDNAVGQLIENKKMTSALSPTADAAYVYAPLGIGQHTSCIVFWLRQGKIMAIYIADGMDGRLYGPV
ncbi:MAG: hypothetical protein K6B40_08520 [Firmicutes bacterium]|nr:hypothetical protein [Bacillota bacterium]